MRLLQRFLPFQKGRVAGKVGAWDHEKRKGSQVARAKPAGFTPLRSSWSLLRIPDFPLKQDVVLK